MDRNYDIVQNRQDQTRNRVANYLQDFKNRFFNTDRRINRRRVTIFRSETDLTDPSFQNLLSHSSVENLPLSNETFIELEMASNFSAEPSVGPLRAIGSPDPTQDRLQCAMDRLQFLTNEFERVSLNTQQLQASVNELGQTSQRQQGQINESRQLIQNAQDAHTHLRNSVATQFQTQNTLNERTLNSLQTQNESQQRIHNELQTQIGRIDEISRTQADIRQALQNDFQTQANRFDEALRTQGETNENFRQNLEARVTGINDSVQDWRAAVDQSQQQLREQVETLRNRPVAVGNGQQIINFENFLSSETSDILKSLIDFDTKSNESIKRFINTTDMLWNQIDKNVANNVNRFNFKVKVKLAKCNQSFLSKINNLNWPQIRDEILKDYSVNSARDTQAQMNTLHQKSGESLFEFANRTKQLLFDMNSFLGANSDPGMVAINDRSARMAFEKGLSDSSLRNFIRNVPTRDLNELIATTVERHERNLVSTPRMCTLCHKGPHKEADCRSKRVNSSNDNRNNNNNSNNNNNRGNNSNNRNNNNNRNDNSNNNRGNQNQNSGSGPSRNSNYGNSNQNRSNNNQTNNNSGSNRSNNTSGSNRSNNNSGHNSHSGQSNNNFNRNNNQSNNNSNAQSFSGRVFDNSSFNFNSVPNATANLNSNPYNLPFQHSHQTEN